MAARLFCGARTVLSFYGHRRQRRSSTPRRERRKREPFPVLLLLLEHLHTSGCRHYPAEITFLPVVATSSFLPYLWETFPPPRELEEEEEEEDEDEDEGSGSLAGKGGDRDEVVKSLGRLKIIQGSSLRADALPALKETSNLLPPAIAQGTDRSLAVL